MKQENVKYLIDIPSYLHNSNRYLQSLRSVTAQMRDYREPFIDGIDK